MPRKNHLPLIIIFMTAGVLMASASPDSLTGKWELIPRESSGVDLFSTVSLEFKEITENEIVMVERWGNRRSHHERLHLKLGGVENRVPIEHKVFAGNVFMGLRREPGTERVVRAYWEESGRSLRLEESFPLLSSQGRRKFQTKSTITLDPGGNTMTWVIHRPTRPPDQPVTYRMKREGYRHAYYYSMDSDWTIDGLLPEQAALISLQGVINEAGPLLYFLYPETWDFRFTDEIFEYYRDKKQFTFKELKSLRHALLAFRDRVDHYIVWDKAERTSLIVAYTLAGLEDALVVTEDLIPLMEEFGLEKIEDFRGKFAGQSDYEIYSWAYDKYWERTNKDKIVWLGGEHGNRMRPGVADFGMFHETFFTDLSTDPDDRDEYRLADKLFSEMNEMGPGFEVVPLDIFLKLAAAAPTFETYTLPEK